MAALLGCVVAGPLGALAQEPLPLRLPPEARPATIDPLANLPGIPIPDPMVHPARLPVLDESAADPATPPPPPPTTPPPGLMATPPPRPAAPETDEPAEVPTIIPTSHVANPSSQGPTATPQQAQAHTHAHAHPARGRRAKPCEGEALCGAGQILGGAGQMVNGLGGVVRGTGRLVGAGFHALGECSRKLGNACGGLFHHGHHALGGMGHHLDQRGTRLISPPAASPPPPLLSEQSIH